MNRRRPVFLSFIVAAILSCLPAIQQVHSQDPTPSPSPTPTPTQVDKVELHQALLDLTNFWTVMCVAAHPDDEDGTTLTVLRRKYGVHTVSLFSTYGEGGQNAIGPELYEELGVIRASETKRAAAIQGSEPYFLGVKDFGFSKSAEEAFRFWGHDEALRRMVLKIRELHPDVIITNHDTTSGHGHHQATGRLALEAFEAAADPKRFPEQLSQVSVWQVKRLFVRYRQATSETVNPAEQLVVIDPNEIDPVRGSSFGEQALQALQQHASQGPWPANISALMRAQNSQTGKLNLIRYKLVKTATDSPALTITESARPFVEGLTLPEEVAKRLTPPQVEGVDLPKATDDEAVLDTLIEWRKSVSRAQHANADPARFASLNASLNRALAVASAIKLSISSTRPVLVPGTTHQINVSIANEGTRIFRLNELRLNTWQQERLDAAEHLLPGTETSVPVDLSVPANAAFTVPKAEHLYDGLVAGKTLFAEAELEIEGGARLTLSTELSLDVAPAVEISNIIPAPYVLTPRAVNKPVGFQIEIRNNLSREFRGLLKLTSPPLNVFEFGRDFSVQPLETQTVNLQVNTNIPRRQQAGLRTTNLSIVTADNNELITERQLQVVSVDARVPARLRVGYVPSFDQTLETALSALGVEATSLSMDDVKSSDLSSYSTIVIDNRGYEAHPELVTNNARLLQFVNDGGTLIVFYQREAWNADEKRGRPQLAPYPITVGSDRVTEEDAAIRFRLPAHRLLNYPNKITQKDFADWIQERGLNYPKEWDPKYEMLFSTHDTGEKPLYGGLLVARYGKGNYIYTSMVWYRQLRGGVSGGYRMFANLISY
jgi:LmbE family N-acetylglucosaminyl deacetylase